MSSGKLAFFFLLFCASLPAFPHPGPGIVKDSKGNIYYTDLKQIWKLSPRGTKSIAVPDVHAHELYMDARDHLYGEHLWYEGEASDKWGHYVWCLQPGGRVVKVKDSTEGFLQEYSFVRDRSGSMYWVERGDTCRFVRRDTTGRKTIIHEGVYRNVRWMHCSEEGDVYFLDLDALYKIPQGEERTQLLVSELAGGSWKNIVFDRMHSVFGIWLDREKNIYAAVLQNKCVKKITPEGEVSIVCMSEGNWDPTGGLFDDAGNLWILEVQGWEARVRQVPVEDLPAAKAWLNVNTLFFIVLALLSAFVIDLFLRKKRRAATKGSPGD